MILALLETLPTDIYSLFNPNETHEVNEEYLNEFTEGLKAIIRTRFTKADTDRGPLRFSALGRPDRQIWYDAHPNGTKEEMSGQTYYKFLFGDVIEQLLLYL